MAGGTRSSCLILKAATFVALTLSFLSVRIHLKSDIGKTKPNKYVLGRPASKMPPFKDENILIIAPGSQTTLAQLGLPESFTPPTHRFPSRMFPAPDGKTYEPYKIQARKKAVAGDGDVDMEGTEANADEEEELLEYPDDGEGAIYPLKGAYSSARSP